MAGLVATVITKWKANDKYSFGYVRAETLAGFINGLFLLFISFFIFSEVRINYQNQFCCLKVRDLKTRLAVDRGKP